MLTVIGVVLIILLGIWCRLREQRVGPFPWRSIFVVAAVALFLGGERNAWLVIPTFGAAVVLVAVAAEA
jgi:hypothetical protein